ncbi:MAG: serine hydrolase domain-containing protein [Armatimonadota bacterium]
MNAPLSPARRRFAATLLVLLAGTVPRGAFADAIDDYVRAEMEKQHIPGLSLAVVKNGKVVRVAGYGVADVEKKLPATPDTVYEIGSLTKQFTAVAILMLEAERKVGLDHRVSKYVAGTPAAWKDITLRHLLTHTSGIKNYTDLPNFDTLMVAPTTREGLVSRMAALPLEFAPGAKWDYSNTGYFLLGLVIEKAAEKSYAAFLKERIFTPLGMTSTAVLEDKAAFTGLSKGYQWNKNANTGAEVISMTWPFSAGAIVSTVNDIARWDAALYTDRLLRRSRREAMWTPVTLTDGTKAGYGFGWDVGSVRGHRNVSHGGGIPGFTSYISRFPDDGWTVVVLTNQGEGAKASSIVRGITERTVPTLAPVASAAIEDREPKVTALVKSVYEQAARGEIDAARFTAPLAGAISTQLKAGFQETLQSWGALESVVLLERREANGNQIYRYRLVYKNNKALTVCTIDKDGKITGLQISPE